MWHVVPVLLAILALPSPAFATWSVIPVDRTTGRVVIASATCVDRDDQFLMGVQAVIVLGKGVAACQAAVEQAGAEVSPPLAWSNVPDDAASFVLIVRDADTAIGNGTDDILQWMLWNIPKGVRALSEGIAQGSQLPDGTRQISASGPYYRGPDAAASGPAHHYVFDIYALDAPIDVPATGQSPPQTRAAVMAAMAGKVRAKGALVGLFRRP